MFGAIFAVPHLVMAIKASEFYQDMPNEKMSQGKTVYFYTTMYYRAKIELALNYFSVQSR